MLLKIIILKNLFISSLIIFCTLVPTKASPYSQDTHTYYLNKLVDAYNNKIGPIDPQLEVFRNKIDDLDSTLLKVISERMNIAKDVGEYKKLHNMAIYQPERYKDLIKTRTSMAESIGLDKEFAEKLFKLIHDESVNLQKHIK